MSTTVKFFLPDYAGTPRSFWIASSQPLTAPTPTRQAGHRILLVDESGSMYGSINQVKSDLEKVVTLDEFHDADLLVSIAGFSSSGELLVYCERTPIQEVNKPGSPVVTRIRAMRARNLTCASQALHWAQGLLRNNETTFITLFTDGYFNDPDPRVEQRLIERTLAAIRPMPDVMISTVGYGYADFALLDNIANQSGGRMVRAGSLREVYEAIRDTTRLLAGKISTPVVIPLDDAAVLVAVDIKTRKINGSTTDLVIRGLSENAAPVIWRYCEVTEKAYEKNPAPTLTPPEPAGAIAFEQLEPLYAMARWALAANQGNKVKYAMLATRDIDLIRDHLRALTVDDRVALAEALDARIFRTYHLRTAVPESMALVASNPPLQFARYTPATGPSVVQVAQLLTDFTDSFTVDLDYSLGGYQRRGVKQLLGRWQEDDTGLKVFTPGRYVTRARGNTVRVSSVQFSNASATLNLRCVQPAELVDLERAQPVPFVTTEEDDRVSLESLENFRCYTLVGDGAVTLPTLGIRVERKPLWDALIDAGLVESPSDDCELNGFRAGKLVMLPLKDLPVLSYAERVQPPTRAGVDALYRLKALASWLSAMLPDGVAGPELSPAVITALRAVHVTAGMNFTPPKTTPYVDRAQAIANGEIDSRVGYEVTVGRLGIMDEDKIRSANAFLARRYQVRLPDWASTAAFAKELKTAKAQAKKAGEAAPEWSYAGPETDEDGWLKAPKVLHIYQDGVQVRYKPLTATAQAALTAADHLQDAVYGAAMGLTEATAGLDAALVAAGLAPGTTGYSEALRALDPRATFTRGNPREEFVAALLHTVKAEQERLRAQICRPLAFSIGATGLIPEDWSATVLDGPAFKEKYPEAGAASGALASGLFIVLDDGAVVTVSSETRWYSTEKGVAVARALQGSNEDVDE